MSQQYNQQPPYYNYPQQHTPGPPQPQWQAPPGPRRGWGDPRLQQNTHPASSPVSPYHSNSTSQLPGQPPPPPPPPPQYAPPPQSPYYGNNAHAPQASQHGNTAWGVRYNQSHAEHLEPKPTLPPRPTSAAGQQGQEQVYGYTTPQYTGIINNQPISQHNWSDSRPHANTPPVPPPRPPQYATQGQSAPVFPHLEYSHQPTSHHYEPSSQGQSHTVQQDHTVAQGSSAPQWNQPTSNDGPVSPLDGSRNKWPSTDHGKWNHPAQAQTHGIPPISSTALGYGQPSDWQHYQTADQYDHDQATQEPHSEQTPQVTVATPEQIPARPVSTQPAHLGASQITPPPHQSMQHTQYRLDMMHSGSSQSLPMTDHGRRQSSTPSLSGAHRTGTIDSVINAWNMSPGPANTAAQTQSARIASPSPALHTASIQTSDSQTQTDFPPIIKTETKTETVIETREVDPFADIHDEYRTSLNRYANMLRHEMTAQGEEAKMKFILDFINREIQLRSVLYNVESASLIRTGELAKLKEAAERPHKTAIPLPPPPPPTTATVVEPAATPKAEVAPKIPPVRTDMNSSTSTKDDLYVVVDNHGDDAEFSPGGRPKMAPARVSSPKVETNNQKSRSKSVDQTAGSQVQKLSPGVDAPMLLEDYIMPGPPSPTYEAPIVVGPEDMPPRNNREYHHTPAPSVPINFQPPRPAYTPFRYQENAENLQPMLTGERSVDEAYSKLRQDQAKDPERLLHHEFSDPRTVTTPSRGHSSTPSISKMQQQETFMGLIRQQSKAIRRTATPAMPGAPLPLRVGTPQRQVSTPSPKVQPLVKSVQSLRVFLPTSLPPPTSLTSFHPTLVSIAGSMSRVPDDFNFIHATVVAWDRSNRQVIAKLESERAARQSENESRIDQLFNDNEIGYADIAELENEFKLEEANKKYQEEQDVLESFIQSVFEKVTTRLEDELTELGETRAVLGNMLDNDAVSFSHQLHPQTSETGGKQDKPPLEDVMNLMLRIYNKIGIRHVKMAEAVFERERRRKRLELSIFYTNGDSAGVKKVEQEFKQAEAVQILAEARKVVERANQLIDSFDRAVVRGLAENQSWLEDAVNRMSLLRDLVLGSDTNGPSVDEKNELFYGPRGIKELMKLLQNAIDRTVEESTNFLKMSYTADGILNKADYSMCVAEAEIADTNKSDLEKLQLEKVKEDEKLREEFEGRLKSISSEPDELQTLVREIRDWVGDDSEHRIRMGRALEQAKRRNTEGNGSGEG